MGIERYGIDKSVNSMAGLSAYENGGPGSGNFGHAGRPGQQGGSGKGEALLSEKPQDPIKKILGEEKITEGKTKADDDKNYRKLEKDIDKLVTKLSKEKSRENFGSEEIRALRDKYSDYMSGNWSVTGRFQERVRKFEDWCDNYQNY